MWRDHIRRSSDHAGRTALASRYGAAMPEPTPFADLPAALVAWAGAFRRIEAELAAEDQERRRG